MINAILLHPQRLGDPVALTVNFAAALQDGAFRIEAVPVRTNRSTQHWTLSLCQQDEILMTGTAITAVRRETWGVDDEMMPDAPAPEEVPTGQGPVPMEWIKRYEIRPLWGHSAHMGWQRGQQPVAPVVARQPAAPAGLCLVGGFGRCVFPRVFVRRATLVPIGTISLSVYFHASEADLRATGDGYLLGQARAKAFRNGYFDQTGLLWNQSGRVLATTHQVVYYKTGGKLCPQLKGKVMSDILIHTESGVQTLTINRIAKKTRSPRPCVRGTGECTDGVRPGRRCARDRDPGDVTVFCAGNDIEDFLQRKPADGESPAFVFCGPSPISQAAGGGCLRSCRRCRDHDAVSLRPGLCR